MSPSRRALLAAAVVVAVAAAAVGYVYFAPKGTRAVDEDIGDAGAVALATGAFSGADAAHRVSGTVTLHRGSDGAPFLRFEDYAATDGPDVYFYLVPRGGDPADPESGGVLVPVPGGRDGQATLRGSFNVPLPDGVGADGWGGVSVWCDRFNVLFGDAPLAPVPGA